MESEKQPSVNDEQALLSEVKRWVATGEAREGLFEELSELPDQHQIIKEVANAVQTAPDKVAAAI